MRVNSMNAAKNSAFFAKAEMVSSSSLFYQINSKKIVFTIFMTIFATKNSREIVEK